MMMLSVAYRYYKKEGKSFDNDSFLARGEKEKEGGELFFLSSPQEEG